MNTKKLTVLALADMMLATDGSVDSLVAACRRVFDLTPPWAPVVCAALAARTGGGFHCFSRQELAALLWRLLGLGEADGEGGEGATDAAAADAQTEGQADAAAPAAAALWTGVLDLPPVRRYCTDPPLRPAQPQWLAALALPALPTVGALAAWLDEPVGGAGLVCRPMAAGRERARAAAALSLPVAAEAQWRRAPD